ncbi:hypothetical protein WJX82_006139 [Trebouxia sp. C0006]
MLSAVSCITHNVATAQLPALSADSRRACGVQSLRLAGSHEQACVTHSQAFLASARRCGSAKRSSSLRKAAPRDSNGADTSGEFNLTEYVEAKVERVERTDKDSSMLLLKMLDGRGNILPVFVGDNESTALLQEMQRQPSTRPMTHDLMKNSLEMLGYRVSKVRITCLVANTYFARIHFSQGRKSQEGVCHEIDVDARPSDAINMAVRFDAPVYVHKQLAIVEERYADALKLKDKIEGVLNTDRTVRLVVQLEAALHDSRLEEAAQLRDELAREYDRRAAAAVREKQQLDL